MSAPTHIDTLSGLIQYEEWAAISRESRPPRRSVEGTMLFDYELRKWGWLPPLVLRVRAELRVRYRGGAEYRGDVSSIRRHLGDGMRQGVVSEKRINGAQSAELLTSACAITGWATRDGVFFRPYWPGITYLIGVMMPLFIALLLTLRWAIRAAWRANRAGAGDALCGRCLYPLTVPRCEVCPECGTPVRWPVGGAP